VRRSSQGDTLTNNKEKGLKQKVENKREVHMRGGRRFPKLRSRHFRVLRQAREKIENGERGRGTLILRGGDRKRCGGLAHLREAGSSPMTDDIPCGKTGVAEGGEKNYFSWGTLSRSTGRKDNEKVIHKREPRVGRP